MPLPQDSETLRIPAFMRRRSLAARSRKPLLLTALDRKEAGVLPAGTSAASAKKLLRPKGETITPAMLDLFTQQAAPVKRRSPTPRTKIVAPPKIKKLRVARSHQQKPLADSRLRGNEGGYVAARKTSKKSSPAAFSAPLLGDTESRPRKKSTTVFRPPLFANAAAQQKIGEITHYYDKIKVAVIALSAPLSVGDCIRYEITGDEEADTYQQIVESMEIDRVPVFKAGRGDDIGLKLKKVPRLGGAVLKMQG